MGSSFHVPRLALLAIPSDVTTPHGSYKLIYRAVYSPCSIGVIFKVRIELLVVRFTIKSCSH